MKKRNEAPPAPSAPSLEQWGADQDAAKFQENARIMRETRAMRAQLAERDAELERVRKSLSLYEKLDEGRVDPPEWLAPKRPGEHRAIPSLLVTDVHWDEVIRPEEIEGYNAYNRRIAGLRVERAFTKSVSLTRDYFAGVKYDGFQLFLGGDLLSGIIHEELTETNDAAICDSIISVVEPIEAGINLLAKEFKRLHVTAVVGNHGRRTRKPRAKYRAQDNFDWLVYQIVARSFRNRPDITINVSQSADAPETIYSTKYRLTHGDQFRGGSGISAELSPLLLGAHRKTRRQSAIGRPYDVLVMGHFHQTLWLPSKGIIMGGSVVGYNEYDYVSNHSPEPPQCSLWLTTPEHGITLAAPVFVQDRTAEGW